MKRPIYIFLCILLSACGATTSAPPATPKATDSATPEIISTSTVAITSTMQPSSTPALTEIIQIDMTEEARNVLATKAAKFSVNCGDFYIGKDDLSPDENWLAISCGYKRDQTLEIVNHDGKRWVLEFKNYLPKGFEDGGMGNLRAVHWSSDSHYLYFTSYIAYDGGGTCFYGYGIHGLFRIELNTGAVATILPATSSFVGYYIAFSPTGRRLAYEGDGSPVILDLQTGAETKLDIGNQAVGNLTWSPDGTELAYATCEAIKEGNNFSIKRSAVKIFSIQKQASRTILQTEKIMLFIRNWNSPNIMQIIQSQYGFEDEPSQPFDLNTGQWISAPTPTP